MDIFDIKIKNLIKKCKCKKQFFNSGLTVKKAHEKNLMFIPNICFKCDNYDRTK